MNKLLFLDQLKKLVSIPSTADNPRERKRIIDYIETILPHGCKRIRIQNKGIEILIAGNNDLKKPDIAYVVHADVVPGNTKMFTLKVVEDKLTGRGVSDMKFAIPIGIALLKKVIEEKLKLNFTLVITTDEEVGGINGVGYLASQNKIKPKILIVPDWGDNFVFINKSKGVIMIQVESNGKKAHASEIWEGINANDSLCKLATILLEKYGNNNKQKTWKTTMNIGVIQGGTASNQVCDTALMKLDFRFPETRTDVEILSEVKTIAKKINPKLKVSLMVTGLPTKTDIKNPLVKMFIREFENVLGRKIKSDGGVGATDARHFAKSNIPLLVIKPKGGNVHSSNEWISLSSCLKYSEALDKFIYAYENKMYPNQMVSVTRKLLIK